MPLPLLWLALGATAIGAYHQLNTDKRMAGNDELDRVKIPDGAVVCCGIYGVFEHAGIWTSQGIVELKGNGLVRQVSPGRFLSQRSGENIYVACSSGNAVLSQPGVATLAVGELFHYQNYDVRLNNCYRFVWQCISGDSVQITSFNQFEKLLSTHFGCPVHWLKLT